MSELYIGLMSGTSLDGVDGVLAEFDATDKRGIRIHGHCHRPFPAQWRQELLQLNRSGDDEVHRAALAANALAAIYAQTVADLLAPGNVPAAAIRALGAHGQTIRHRPGEFDGTGYTVQLLNGALLAELTAIDTICDFRSRDIAAGGQGAPLVPAFHAALFGQSGVECAILNLGGIGNLTLLGADGSTRGFDCGPGNALLDLWCERHLGRAYDDGGRWSARGRVLEPLLTCMLADPYFLRPPPKSTGRDLFHAEWLDQAIARSAPGAQLAPEDVQATLLELTARSATEAVRAHQPQTEKILVCGGGSCNAHLMARLRQLMGSVPVDSTEMAGLPALQVEAAAFAWLASAYTHRVAASSPAVTGARGPRILGVLHSAG